MVLISYAPADDMRARELQAVLEANDIDCVMAARERTASNDLAADETDFDTFVLLLAEGDDGSSWDVADLVRAIERGVTIIPFHAAPSALADTLDFRLTSVQRIDRYHSLEAAYRELVDTILMSAGHEAGPSHATRDTSEADELFTLGLDHFWGRRVARDYEKALALVNRAVALGPSEDNLRMARELLPRMNYWAGRSYAELASGRPDLARRAFACYQAAAQLGDTYGVCELGRCYHKGMGVARDQQRAVELASDAAEHGDFGANLDMGRYHYEGDGVARSLAAAVAYFTRAIELNPDAYPYNRAVAYYRIAKCHLQLGHEGEARHALEQARELVGDDRDANAELLLSRIAALEAELEGGDEDSEDQAS